MFSTLLKKAWMETRWRFLIGVALSFCTTAMVVMLWPQIPKLLSTAQAAQATNGPFAEQIKKSLELTATFRGYAWSQLFEKNLSNLATLFAALLGTGPLLAPRPGELFTLSLPVSRGKLLTARAGVGLAELLGIVLAGVLPIYAFSSFVGETYPLATAGVHATALFIGAAVVFSSAFLLASWFEDAWRPASIVVGALVLVTLWSQLSDVDVPFFGWMSAEGYFYDGQIPWLGLSVCLAASTALLYGGALRIARRDF